MPIGATMSENGKTYTEYERGVIDGVWLERAAIVAWLRSFADPRGKIDIDVDDLARIESGEHLRSEQ